MTGCSSETWVLCAEDPVLSLLWQPGTRHLYHLSRLSMLLAHRPPCPTRLWSQPPRREPLALRAHRQCVRRRLMTCVEFASARSSGFMWGCATSLTERVITVERVGFTAATCRIWSTGRRILVGLAAGRVSTPARSYYYSVRLQSQLPQQGARQVEGEVGLPLVPDTHGHGCFS